MTNKFKIKENSFLKKETVGYFHQLYTTYKKPENPDFLNTLKNTYCDECCWRLEEAREKVVQILLKDIPEVLLKEDLTDCLIVCVPRSKRLDWYLEYELNFLEAIKIASKKIPGVTDATDCIKRNSDTKTTHMSKCEKFKNDGDMPFEGITKQTCVIDGSKIKNRNIILIDDIYTNKVNIDEDCIQALLDHGAKKVIFYSIGYTRRTS